MDSILEAKDVQIERKRFHFEFRENERGRFLRITEEAHGRRNTIIVPSSGLNDFTDHGNFAISAGVDKLRLKERKHKSLNYCVN